MSSLSQLWNTTMSILIARVHTFSIALGVAIASSIVQNKTIWSWSFIMYVTLIYNTFWIIKSYAPKLMPGLNQGTGFSLGGNMVGGASNESNKCQCDKNVLVQAITKTASASKSKSKSESKSISKLKKALISSGFDPDWNINKVIEMKRNSKQREKLEDITDKVAE